ncbi:MAG: peptidylprolyl isomerase [Frankiales bacterium]|nr:peptidylprolyl isomerase [Frankiales bacterium]
MRNLRCLCATLFGLILVLTACTGHAGQASSAATAADPNGVAQQGPFPTVAGVFGDKPALSFAAGSTPSSALQRKVLKVGSGPVVMTGDLLAIDYLGQIWNGKVFDNSYDRHAAEGVQIGIGSVLPGWDSGLVGLRVGSRVLLSVPPAAGYGTAGNTAAGIKATDTLVFVIDIAAAYNAHSTADPQAVVQPLPAGAPVVSGPLTVGPTITIPKGLAPPKKKSTYLIAKGSGALITPGTAVVQYQGVDWTGALAGSTWQNGTPTAVPVGSAASSTGGLFDSLQGVPIGSRVLVVAPAPAGQPATTASAAVVVDVVGQITTAKAMSGS